MLNENGTKTEKTKAFEKELTALINKYSLETESNTPDFILSEYLVQCLIVFNVAENKRYNWFTS